MDHVVYDDMRGEIVRSVRVCPILRRLIVFLRSRGLRFAIDGLVVGVGRFVAIYKGVFPGVIDFGYRIYVLTCRVGVFIHDFPRRFTPASLVFFFLQVGVTVRYAQDGVGLGELHYFHVLRYFNVVRRVCRPFPYRHRFVGATVWQVHGSSRAIASQCIRILCFRSSILSVYITRRCGRHLPFFRQSAYQVIGGTMQIYFINFQLGVQVQRHLVILRARISIVLVLRRVVDRVLGREVLTILGVHFRSSHFRIAAHFVFGGDEVVGYVRVLNVRLRFNAEDGPLPISYSTFRSGARELDPSHVVGNCSNDDYQALGVLVRRLHGCAPIFQVLCFRFFGVAIVSYKAKVVGRVVRVEHFHGVVNRHGERVVHSTVQPTQVVRHYVIAIGELFGDVFSLVEDVIPARRFRFSIAFSIFSHASVVFVRTVL